MTGGAFFAAGGGDDEYDLDEQGVGAHAVQWVGKPGVKGPKWAKTPLLTVGMLGIQCVWSIEMGYASPYLLELGLSKSWMSLVFMAGPLSGLIVQPLIGIFADRSRNRLGRRRPFMIAGCLICVFAMMLLGWTRELSGLVGGGTGLAIALAVWAIYLIDFSINAVMSADRALVVDTLPPSQQEEGSAWAGRMFGFGSVAGFFVGGLNLQPVLPFLGKTQLQILSFITSSILLLTHTFTSWAVTERVLLRDDRPQSKSTLISNLKVIWDNMFTLPPGIRAICYVQFFAYLGWFPILFFTTVWVSEIYKSSTSFDADTDVAQVNADAVRAGNRALLLQSIVNIITSVGLPFLVAESGVQPASSHAYTSLNGEGMVNGQHDVPNSAMWKRARADIQDGGAMRKVVGFMRRLRDGSALQIPIKGVTVVKVWWISQFVFAGAMAASWFVSTVHGAYMVIAVTGFCWALSQWAPYSLLGELILIDGTVERGAQSIQLRAARPSTDMRRSSEAFTSVPLAASVSASSSNRHTPLHSRHTSRTSLTLDDDRPLPLPANVNIDKTKAASKARGGLSPLIVQNPTRNEDEYNPEFENSLVLRHSDESDRTDPEAIHDGASPSPTSPYRHQSSPLPGNAGSNGGKDTADKAGVILGIHNVFLVLPQFVVTFLSSIIFYLMEPERQLPDHHPNAIPISNVTAIEEGEVLGDVIERTMKLVVREGGVGGDASSPDAVGLIFRIGGVSAAIGGYICWRLAKRWQRGEGI
ncbi:major facilitator superfamily domain-containing protein [Naematelia encephala]|uniref:Major facilitator superfamily domain-containing protein n=1 Tax=Naematelia encephala TaxID=71784 RepID=A0A1Y2BDH8_9TREE|nr:major facilitator superfamily domain-containing protein [Naematelia encephala]